MGWARERKGRVRPDKGKGGVGGVGWGRVG